MSDAFPRYMSGFINLSGINTFTTSPEQLPVNRGGFVSGVAMEFLWATVHIVNTDLIASGDSVEFAISVGSTPTAVRRVDDPDVLGGLELRVNTATAVGYILLDEARRIEWQTQDGHGQLVAADQIHISANSTTQAAIVTFIWRIYYRFVKVGDRALFGIIQSQS